MGILVHNIHTVAGGAGQNNLARLRLRPVLQGNDRILDRLAERLDQAVELARIAIHPAVERGIVLAGNKHHLRHQNARIPDQRAAGFQHDHREVRAEVLGQIAGNLGGVFRKIVGRLRIGGREAAAHIDHLQRNAFFLLKGGHQVLRLGDGVVPLPDIALLAADVKGYAVGGQALFAGLHEKVVCHVGMTAEFARKRPVGGHRVLNQYADVDLRARSAFRDIPEVFLAVGGVHTDALFIEIRNVFGFLDGISVADSFGSDPEGKDLVQFVSGGNVKIGTKLGQEGDNLGRRVCLYRIIDMGEREGTLQFNVVLLDRPQVDHHEGCFEFIRKLEKTVPVGISDILFSVHLSVSHLPKIVSNFLKYNDA